MTVRLNIDRKTNAPLLEGIEQDDYGVAHFEVAAGAIGDARVVQAVSEALEAALKVGSSGMDITLFSVEDRDLARKVLLDHLDGTYRSIQTSDKWWQIELNNGSVVRISSEEQAA